jgi:hypothetical protein
MAELKGDVKMGEQQEMFICECGCGGVDWCRADAAMDRESSLRWHMTSADGTRVFIMYGSREDVQASADGLGYINVEASGYYSYKTNRIYNAGDGPMVYEDNRRASNG